MEADLDRFYQRDLRDLWRGSLTLRQIAVRLRHLPADSAIRRALDIPDWSTTDYLLSDVVHALTGQPHPLHPAIKAKAHAEASALAAAKRRAEARRARLGITGSVLRRPRG